MSDAQLATRPAFARDAPGARLTNVVPCGAYAVIEWDSGSPRVKRWCERRRGPCPFPGADKTGDRPCAEKAEAAS